MTSSVQPTWTHLYLTYTSLTVWDLYGLPIWFSFFEILVLSLLSCISLVVLFFNALVLPRPCWLSLAYLEWVYKGYFIISEAIIRMWFPISYNKMLLLLAPTICYICRTLLTLNHQSCIVSLKYLFISYILDGNWSHVKKVCNE